jgi:putative tryptophan/tyrosine transport system substrate-binding protein
LSNQPKGRVRLCVGIAFLALSLVAHAQTAGKVPRIGWLGGPAASSNADQVEGFRTGLQERGYTEGKNIVIEFRFADGQVERLPGLALELVRGNVDAIVVTGSQAGLAAKGATASIPIVMAGVGDPVGIGLVASLARPAGNVTGVSAAHGDISAKWLELLLEVAPKLSIVGYLDDPTSPVTPFFLKNILATGRARGVAVHVFSMIKPDDLDSQLIAMTRAGIQGIVVGPNPVPRARQKDLLSFAAKHRLPAIYGGRDYVEAGGLMSYDPSRRGTGRQAALYVDRLLKGAKPADLPVEQPTRIELGINLKTAKAFGLTIPAAVLLRADYVVD